jgi:hypothetical protein
MSFQKQGSQDSFILTSYTGTAPGAGNNFAVVLPQGQNHQILAVQFVLTTDANAADRYITVSAGISTTQMMKAPSIVKQIASKGYEHNFGVGIAPLDATTGANTLYSPLPDHMINKGGYNLRITVLNIQAGDVLADIVYYLKSWMA